MRVTVVPLCCVSEQKKKDIAIRRLILHLFRRCCSGFSRPDSAGRTVITFFRMHETFLRVRDSVTITIHIIIVYT